MTIDYHRLARDEFKRAVRYLHRDDPGKATRFAAEVYQARCLIFENPMAGSPTDDHHRFVRTKHFRYILYYRYFAGTDFIMIYAVAHASRKPGYGLRRTKRP